MKSNQNIFERACLNGCLEVVKLCVENDTTVTDWGNCTLRESIARNQYEIVKYLLENGGDPYDYMLVVGSIKIDAFNIALDYNRIEMLDLLKQYGR